MTGILSALRQCTTAVAVVRLYEVSNDAARLIIRAAHPRMRMEFDAVDREECRARRKAAQNRT